MRFKSHPRNHYQPDPNHWGSGCFFYLPISFYRAPNRCLLFCIYTLRLSVWQNFLFRLEGQIKVLKWICRFLPFFRKKVAFLRLFRNFFENFDKLHKNSTESVKKAKNKSKLPKFRQKSTYFYKLRHEYL